MFKFCLKCNGELELITQSGCNLRILEFKCLSCGAGTLKIKMRYNDIVNNKIIKEIPLMANSGDAIEIVFSQK